MSIISKARELVKKLKTGASSVTNYFNPTSNNGQNFWSTPTAQKVANVQRGIQTISPKIEQFGQNIQKATAPDFTKPTAGNIAKTFTQLPGMFVGGNIETIGRVGRTLSNPNTIKQAPNFTLESFVNPAKPSKASIISDVASILPAVGAVSSKVRTASTALKPFLPEIRAVRNILGETDNIPQMTPAQLKAAEDLVVKIKGSNTLKQMVKLNPLPKDYLNSIRSFLNVTEDQILNPTLDFGLSVKNLKRQPSKLTSVGKILEEKGVNGKSPQLEVPSTNKTNIGTQLEGVPTKVDASIPGSTAVSSSTDIIDPIEKITNALKVAKPLEQEQGKIYSQIRSRQAGALSGIGGQMGGESAYYKKLGQLKGEMPKVQFESIRKSVTQDDINEIFNRVEKSNLSVFEKVSAQGALTKLLGAQGGSVPTRSELTLLNEVFPPEFIQAVLDNRSGFQKALSLAEGFLNLPRAVMATADLSAPLRQGIFLVGRPKQWIPAFKNMFKYALNENAYKNLADDIKMRPNAKLYREANLAITDNSPVLGNREELFMSNLTEKIPVFGKIAGGSNRAYSGFLNKLRVDVFDDLVSKARQQGIEVDGKVLQDIGSFVNAATGRGSLPKFIEKSAPALNAVFFSPRLMASRINLLNPAYYAKLDPFVRKEALKSLFTFGATAGTVLGLAKLAGADVNVDPRNADFGKIKVGNTRYDVLGGFQQYIRLAAQLISGQIVSSTTGKVITLGEGYKPLTRKDILLRFFENKTSPVASFAIAMATGTNSLGDKFNLPSEVINRFIPMVAQDVYDLVKEWGPAGALMAIPGIFGAGSQTYGGQELVKGKNQLGEETSQLRSTRGLNEVISDKVFGAQPLGTTAQYSADAYFKELQKLPKEEAAKKFQEIAKTNPEIAKKILDASKDYKKGITPNDETLKAKGVTSGDRAVAIVKQFKKLKTKEEKAKLWNEYVDKGIITPDVAKQIKVLLSQ